MLNQIRNLIIDMDGVLWHGNTPLPGFNDFFDTLHALDLNFVLATNNAARTPDQYQQKLAKLDVTVEKTQIITSAEATGQYIAKQHPAGTAVYVVGDDGLREAMTSRGFRLVTPEQAADGETAAVVTVGFTRHITYPQLAMGSLLVHKGADFIGSNPDVSYPSEYGPLPGAGALIALIQAATGVEPTIIGKPGPIIFREAMERLGGAPDNTAMIGDRLNTDIAGAKAADLYGILLLSGISTREDLANSPVQPDLVLDDLVALTAALRDR